MCNVFLSREVHLNPFINFMLYELSFKYEQAYQNLVSVRFSQNYFTSQQRLFTIRTHYFHVSLPFPKRA